MFGARRSAAIVALALLSACGGGGGDGAATSSSVDFPIAAALSAYEVSAHQFSLAGSLDGTNFTASLNQTPGPASTFEGKTALTATQTLALSANGVLAGQSTSRSYFAVNPYVSYGSIDQDDGHYTVFNQTAAFPVTAKVGQTGALGTETEYASSAKLQALGSDVVTWSLEADTATTALFCLNFLTSGQPALTGSECYRVTAAGQVSGLVLKITSGGKTLTLQ